VCVIFGSGMLYISVNINRKVKGDITSINASMSSVKTNEKFVDRKSKGCLEK
jgi:hypothetical protein